MTPRTKIAPLAQGIFYAAAGLWPIVHLRSFEAVTGPKTDDWLVRTTGGLIAAIGTALIVGALAPRKQVLRTIGIGSALVLGTSALVYGLRDRISKIYLADAAVEAGLVGMWAANGR